MAPKQQNQNQNQHHEDDGSCPLQPFDGERGKLRVGGWWIDCEEAKENCVGKEEWWTQPGGRDGQTIVPMRQYDPHGPSDKPIWMFLNGDMYLGPWQYKEGDEEDINGDEPTKGEKAKGPLQCGFGIAYTNNFTSSTIQHKKWLGNMYVGYFDEGECHGHGKFFWVESSPTWKDNYFPGSEIKEPIGDSATAEGILLASSLSDGRGRPGKKRSVSRPYTYTGIFQYGSRNDSHAIVTLKDGTTRIGPWKQGAPVGNWWTHHEEPTATSSSSAKAQSTSESLARTRSSTTSITGPIDTDLYTSLALPRRSGESQHQSTRKKRTYDDVGSPQEDGEEQLKRRRIDPQQLGIASPPELAGTSTSTTTASTIPMSARKRAPPPPQQPQQQASTASSSTLGSSPPIVARHSTAVRRTNTRTFPDAATPVAQHATPSPSATSTIVWKYSSSSGSGEEEEDEMEEPPKKRPTTTTTTTKTQRVPTTNHHHVTQLTTTTARRPIATRRMTGRRMMARGDVQNDISTLDSEDDAASISADVIPSTTAVSVSLPSQHVAAATTATADDASTYSSSSGEDEEKAVEQTTARRATFHDFTRRPPTRPITTTRLSLPSASTSYAMAATTARDVQNHDIIYLLDSDEEADVIPSSLLPGVGTMATTAPAFASPVTSTTAGMMTTSMVNNNNNNKNNGDSSSGIDDETLQAEHRLTEWLIRCIGGQPIRAEMAVYARKLREFGCHSSEIVVQYCEPEDVLSFDWMRDIHKRIFLSKYQTTV